MARKRKPEGLPSQPSVILDGLTVFETALYGRLSVLDNGKVDGDSLESQIALMEQYVAQRPYLHYVKLYQDNGYTGTNFDRPAWDELLRDVRSGRINCIVVKDLSRLGRNYIETGEFLEKDCPRLGVRFISINDGYDSAALNSTEELTAALKNIINDYYAKDISRKACSALATKRKRGEYIGSYAPYGYQKDPANKNHLIIDPVTAPIVRQIYEWRAEGAGYGTITRRLNEQDIPSPGRYRFEQGIVTNNNKKGTKLLWNRHALTDILRNPVYIGHLAQGKCRASLYQGIPAHTVSEEEWDIAYHTHDPILSQELFDAVQRCNEERSAAYQANYGKYAALPKETNPYGEKLVCADCGARLKLTRSLANGGKRGYYSYLCPTYEEHRDLRCSKKSIRSFALDEAVLAALKIQMDLFLDEEAVLKSLLCRARPSASKAAKTDEKRSLERQIERRQSLSASLYADWKSGILSREEYDFGRQKYVQELEELSRQLRELESVGGVEKERLDRATTWANQIKRFQSTDTVTKELVDAFIGSIRLDSKGQISVDFLFADDHELIRQEIKRLKKEAA